VGRGVGPLVSSVIRYGLGIGCVVVRGLWLVGGVCEVLGCVVEVEAEVG
jgi:hypothetical protein